MQTFNTVQVKLSRGEFALIDASDAERVGAMRWYLNPGRHTNYARSDKGRLVRSRIYMHRFILAAPRGVFVDHINGNGLDNRRENLRLVTPSQNGHNRRRWHSPHGRTGITYDKRRGKWVAQITINYKHRALGRFNTREEAIAARELAEKELT